MEKIIFSFLIITGSCCWGEKYVFVKSPPKSWADAKDYCQDRYTNILSLENKYVEEVFKKSVNKTGSKKGWIGMYWEKNTETKWRWWEGGKVHYSSTLNLSSLNPADNVYWTENGWKKEGGTSSKSFFCLNMLVVQEKKTWEDALEHCRRNGGDLISLLSWTEKYWAWKKIEPPTFTDPVWIGMHYFGDSWMWVNGDPLVPWLLEGDLSYKCPTLRRCGALTKEVKRGKLENRDCQEKLNFICA